MTDSSLNSGLCRAGTKTGGSEATGSDMVATVNYHSSGSL